MRGLSLWQPWASLIAAGAKQYETRSWDTAYRGRIAIHASKKSYQSAINVSFPDPRNNPDRLPFVRAAKEATGGLFPMEYPLGAYVATATLAACLHVEGRGFRENGRTRLLVDPTTGAMKDIDVDAKELLFGDWDIGRFVWRLEDVRALAVPLPATGRQGLWNIDENTERELRSLERAVR